VGWNYTGCYFIVNKVDLKNKYKGEIELVEDIYGRTKPLGEDITLIEKINQVYWADGVDNPELREELSELYTVSKDLDMGLSTPIKLEFTTYEPYYPMVITSLSEDYTSIEVYFISDKGVKDKMDLLSVDRARRLDLETWLKVNEYLDVGNDIVLTRLRYYGRADELSEDSVFVKSLDVSVSPARFPKIDIFPLTAKNILRNLARLLSSGIIR